MSTYQDEGGQRRGQEDRWQRRLSIETDAIRVFKHVTAVSWVLVIVLLLIFRPDALVCGCAVGMAIAPTLLVMQAYRSRRRSIAERTAAELSGFAE